MNLEDAAKERQCGEYLRYSGRIPQLISQLCHATRNVAVGISSKADTHEVRFEYAAISGCCDGPCARHMNGDFTLSAAGIRRRLVNDTEGRKNIFSLGQ